MFCTKVTIIWRRCIAYPFGLTVRNIHLRREASSERWQWFRLPSQPRIPRRIHKSTKYKLQTDTLFSFLFNFIVGMRVS